MAVPAGILLALWAVRRQKRTNRWAPIWIPVMLVVMSASRLVTEPDMGPRLLRFRLLIVSMAATMLAARAWLRWSCRGLQK
jgi:cell division protein FtsW (lipid II flippase)